MKNFSLLNTLFRCVLLINLMVLPAYAAEGDIDPNFNPNVNGGNGGRIYTVATQSNGDVLLGGDFSTIGSNLSRTGLARVKQNGVVDTSMPDYGMSFVFDILTQSNDQFLAGGLFGSVLSGNITVPSNIVRFTASGAVDTSFNGPGANNRVESIALQSDGKILIGGDFTGVAGNASTQRLRFARLNSDSTRDDAFTVNADARVNSIAVASNGDIYAGGFFTFIKGARDRLARISPTGSLDPSFIQNLNGIALEVTIQGDGKVLVGGDFSIAGNNSRNGLVRFNADGTIDSSFTPSVQRSVSAKTGSLLRSSSANGRVFSMAIQEDGKIIIVGDFTSVAGIPRANIARLNSDGSLDTDFSADTDGIVRDVALDEDENIIVGGDFTTIKGVSRHLVARIEGPKVDEMCMPIKAKNNAVAVICI